MFFSLVERYADCVIDYEVLDFRKYGSARALVARITFIDQSTLHIKDYLFADGDRKYSYHWQTAQGELRARWDNAPHHRHINTFPHHRHSAECIRASHNFTLPDVVVESIAEELRGQL